jgi:hypothetical protein
MEHKDQLALLEQKATAATMVQKALLVLLVRQVQKVIREKKAYRANVDILDKPDQLVHRVLLAQRAQRVQKVIQDAMPQCTFKQLLLTIVLEPLVIFGINSNHAN